MLVEWGLAGVGVHREKVVCGFLSQQLGEKEQPNSTDADEMEEIEDGLQVE